MDPISMIQDPAWSRALTLDERRRMLDTAWVQAGAHDETLAAKRLARWRAQVPFGDDRVFDRRLEVEAFDLTRFNQLLGTHEHRLAEMQDAAPDWLRELARAFDHYPEMRLPDGLEQACATNATLGFLVPIAPLIQTAVARTRAGVTALCARFPTAPLDPKTTTGLLLVGLAEQLIGNLYRTMILELHVARLGGCLDGADAAGRFTSFIQQMRDPERAWLFLQEYPVLARRLVTAIDQRVRFVLELVERLCCDHAALTQTFAVADIGHLSQVVTGAGDTHDDGRSVAVLHFSSGFRLVYKPRSLAVEQAFQDLLQQLNQWGAAPSLRTLKILQRADYGWVECVAAGACADQAGAARFFQRQGSLLAVLYALQATDFHHENLIAAGEHPVLIDLESLFHPHLGMPADGGGSQWRAMQAMNYSVLRIGLLPSRLFGQPGGPGIDVSGLAGEDGQLSPFAMPMVDGGVHDDFRVVHRQVALPGADNRAHLDGKVLNGLDYADDLCAGFTAMYQLLQRRQAALTAEDGLLQAFADVSIRVILRPTRIYGLFLRDALHPDHLRDGLDRDRFFDRLWANIDENPDMARIIPHERHDLLRGDVPMFTAKPNDRALWRADSVAIPDFLDEMPLARVCRGLAGFNHDDLNRQIWFIKASLATLQHHHDHVHRRGYLLPEAPAAVAPSDLIAAAVAVADHLREIAVAGEKDCTWIGVTMARFNEWTLNPLGPDLYDGLPGLILFLAYLAEVDGAARHRAFAERALVSLEAYRAGEDLLLTTVGAFSGLGGMVYLYTHLGVLWRRHDYLERAVAYAARITQLVDRDTHYDLISGAAGALVALLGLYRVDPNDDVLAAAVACGDHLRRRATVVADGVAWQVDSMGPRPLTGFSHGTAGIAYALSALADQTGDGRYHETAQAAFAYERAFFDQHAGNWPDLRDAALLGQAGLPETHFETAWCHGAPGIGLSRVLAGAFQGDPRARTEVEMAVTTTLRSGFGQNHSLCHGDLGNLDILQQIAQATADRALLAEVQRLAAAVVADIRDQGYRCGLPLAVTSPGLMTGLAGIGYGLLRLAAPDAVPSILALAGPVRVGAKHAVPR